MSLTLSSFGRAAAGVIFGCLCTTQAMANPVPADDYSLSNGEELFQRHCTQCHGWEGRGEAGLFAEATDPAAPPAGSPAGSTSNNSGDSPESADATDDPAAESYGIDAQDFRVPEQFDLMAYSTDLTDPESYRNGSFEEDIFYSIAHGTGVGMPAWRSELGSDEAIWDLVNYIQSLWAE